MRTRTGALFASAALVFGAVFLFSCSSDSPTRPRPEGGTGGGGSTNTSFAITVTTSPAEVLVTDTDGVLVRVAVRRNDNGQFPPDGSTITLSADRGSFGSPGGSTTSVVLQLSGGGASVRFFGGTTVGTANLQAQMASSVGQAQVRIVSEAAFVLTSVSPAVGAPSGGDQVTINGQGIAGPVQVTFAPGSSLAASAQVLEVGSTFIRIQTPPYNQSLGVGQSAPVNIQVTIKVGSTEGAASNTQTLFSGFTYVLGGTILRPEVTAVSPTQGPNEGGTRVRITGDGFESPVQVLFGTGSTTSFNGFEATVESVKRNEVVVVSPAARGVGQDNQNRSVAILVRNVVSGFATVATSAFQYGQGGIFISAIAPNQGTHLGGTTVTFHGNGFDEPVAVSLAGIGASIISVTGSQVIVRSNGIQIDNCSDVTDATILVNIETGESATGPDYIYRVVTPFVSGYSPTSLPAAGGTVTITGGNFEDPVQVLFGTRRGLSPVVTDGGTRITVTAPAFDGNFPVVACTTGGGLNGTQQQAVSVSLQVVNSLTTCSDTLQGAIRYNPPNGTCVANEPTANFTFTVNGTVVTFQNTSVNATAFTWTFGDGTGSGASNPTHDYVGSVAPGESATFNVTLTASNVSGSDTITKQVTVTAPPPPPPPPPP